MKLRLNGEFADIPDVTVVSDLLRTLNIQKLDGIAVAVNEAVIRKDRLSEMPLQENDTIEIIRATQGG